MHKVLFFVTEFWQAGGQRYTYEIDHALDKSQFESHFLCFRDLNSHLDWEDHYYQKHLDLGSAVHFYSKFDEEHLLLKTSSLRGGLKRKKNFSKLNSFLSEFDTILIQGEWVYSKFKMAISSTNMEKCHISILNSISQFPENYKQFDKDEPLKFISAFSDEAIKYELKYFTSSSHFHFPLAINLEGGKKKWDASFLNKKRIGIFTRLTKTKPIDTFLYTFQILKYYDPEFELFIYGNGDPEAIGLTDHIRYLNLGDSVNFLGHQDDILESAVRDEIGLTWFLGFHGMPAGFAGYDICSIGLPQLFWDLKPGSEVNNSVIPMFSQIIELAEYSNKLFKNPSEAVQLSERQINYVSEERNISNFIKELEQYLIKESSND